MTTSNDIPLGSKPNDRAAHLRTDTDWLDQAFTSDEVLIFLLQNGAPLVEHSGQSLVWLGPEVAKLSPPGDRIFMGKDKAGSPIFAVEMPEAFGLESSLIAGTGAFSDMRAAAAGLPELQSNLAATARSLFEWHRSHSYCSRCGAPSDVAEAGWKRICPSCGAEHFPRTDPVAIMLAVKDDKCLLGRQAMWPAGFWSALAGFVEPGETVEQAATRELEEEAGIKADPAKAEYLFCQPWPFPSSLMIGIIVEADTTEVSVEQDELEAARWITREEARQVMAGTHPEIYAPPPMAVAHHLLKTWAERD
ncbi:MAG: NAD(+) diphosphatase [Henriciella sp.]|nr:NAD(+) diphosphatase [Henriciella sp.]